MLNVQNRQRASVPDYIKIHNPHGDLFPNGSMVGWKHRNQVALLQTGTAAASRPGNPFEAAKQSFSDLCTKTPAFLSLRQFGRRIERAPTHRKR